MRQFGVRPKRDLGQNFLIDSNILGVIERAAELGRRRRRAGDRRRAGRAQRAPRGARGARPRRRARPRARARARATRSARTRTPRCTSPTRSSSTSRALRPGADEGGRQPALRDRGERDPAHDRGARRRHALGGDGPARGRRALRRRARAPRPTASPACSPSWPATCACTARSRAPSSTRCPTSTRCSSCCDRTGAGARRRRCARSCSAAFAHRRKALARSLALAPGAGPGVRERARAALAGARPSGRRARRAPRAAGVPRARAGTGLPSAPVQGTQPPEGSRGRDRLHDSARRRSTSACSWGPRAPTAATSSSPSSSR